MLLSPKLGRTCRGVLGNSLGAGLLFLFAVAFAAAPAGLLRATDTTALTEALNSIRANELRTHVETLADDSYQGREAGTRGGRAAAEYLQQHLVELGLRGAGDDGGYYQPFGSGCRNVLGLLEGSDPQLKKEIVLLGAHYDHVGYGNRETSRGPIGYIHNGADDNASGVAGVLEAMDAFADLAMAPKRSVLFALWDGEEKGVLGSRHFLAHTTVPFEKIVFSVDVDMIGRMKDHRMSVFGSRTGKGLRRLTAENNQASDLRLDFGWEMENNSDHYSFFARQIPVLMFHTGSHDDLHRPSDDVDRINAEGMESAARLLFQVTCALANEAEICRFRDDSRKETPTHKRRLEELLPPQPPRLGVHWNTQSVDGGFVLTAVTPGSAAQRAGLLPGDRLFEFAGRPVSEPGQFRLDVLAARSPVTVVVHRPGDDQPLRLLVELDGLPTRLGISWRTDDAEPGTVILTRVISGSPAQRAGLCTGDRIYAVAGRSFADSESFSRLVRLPPNPLELTIEREGRLDTIVLELPPPEETQQL